MTDERQTLEVGRIVKAHGLKGQVIVDLWTDRLERLEVGSQLLSDKGPLTVVSSGAHQDKFLVTFQEITDRNGSERWRGTVLRATRLEDDDAIWIDELFNAVVVDQNGVERGKVTLVEEMPASDLLVLDTGFLVPLTFVTTVVPNERIEIDVPEGLFE
ncbi:MAG: ribosome maturation factor RimM [Actinomycetota bacterium]|jgi:16S rRNA processing protein RimM